MIEARNPRDVAIANVIGALLVVEATTYFIATLLHLGVQIPLGFPVLAEPPILPAAIVEGLSGVLLATGAYAVFSRKAWAWAEALGAHLFSIGGVLLGLFALSVGAGPRTELNDVYHRVILVMLVAGLTLLVTGSGRAALGRGTEMQDPR